MGEDYLASEERVERMGVEIQKAAGEVVENKRYRYPTELIAQALHESCGMVYVAARRIGCSSTAIYDRMKDHQELRQIVEEYRGVMIDEAEIKLKDAVLNGEPWAIQLVLRGPGKVRGYAERAEITGGGGKSIASEIFEEALKRIYGGERTGNQPLHSGGE